MSIRSKVLVWIVLLLSILIIFIYIVLSTITLNSFGRLEKQKICTEIYRVWDVINEELERLYLIAEDWGEWDVTYNFMVERNPDTIPMDLTNTTFSNLGLNLMLFLTNNYEIIAGKAYDLEKGKQVKIPVGLQPYLVSDSLLLNHQDIDSYHRGFLLLPEGLLMIASNPILTTESNGPIRGTLLVGSYLNSRKISELNKRLRISTNIYTFQDKENQKRLLEFNKKFNKSKHELPKACQDWPKLVEILDNQTIAGYMLIKDLKEKPIAILKIREEREIFREAQKTLKNFIISLIGLGIFFTILMVVIIEKTVIDKIIKIISKIQKITDNHQLYRRLKVEGNDEITQLSKTLNSMLEKLEIYTNKLSEQVFIDGLTKIANRRKFDEYLQEQWQHCLEQHQPLSLILCDLDFFKSYNDTYGHLAGDECLTKIAQMLNQSVVSLEAIVARYGGEEFGVILPQTNSQMAMEIAENIKHNLKNMKMVHLSSLISDYLTLSIGVATMIPDQELSPQDLVNGADQALYQSKNLGRDRIFFRLK